MREALGRSRGGYGTKACVITDGAGRAISFALAPGQAHELPLAQELVDCLPDVPGWVVGDKGYASVSVCRRQALICWVTRRTKRRDRMEMMAISMKATRCPSVRSKMVFNRR